MAPSSAFVLLSQNLVPVAKGVMSQSVPNGTGSGRPRRVGYGRVSTADQSLGQQEEALRGAGCEVVFVEKVGSGVPSHKRPQLVACLEEVVSGDVLVLLGLPLASSLVLREVVLGNLAPAVRTLFFCELLSSVDSDVVT